MLSSGTLGFCNPFFRNHRCPLWKRFTVLSELMHDISKLIFNFFNKYMAHDTKLFLFFNPNFQWIHFLYICIGLSPQLLMAYLYRHSCLQRDILIDSMRILWDSICGDNRRTEQGAFPIIQLMTYCFSIFLRIIRIFPNNTNFIGVGFRISISCFDMTAIIISPFFMFMVAAVLMNLW